MRSVRCAAFGPWSWYEMPMPVRKASARRSTISGPDGAPNAPAAKAVLPVSSARTAVPTAEGFLEQFSDEPVLVIGSHFATPAAGRIVRDGDVYRLKI